MTDVEARLRATLIDQVADAPTGASMLAEVRVEARRRTRRHRIVTVGAVVVALVASGWAVPTIAYGFHPVRPAASAARSAAPAPPLVHWVPGGPVNITYPFDVPAFAGMSKPIPSLVAGEPTLTYSAVGKLYPTVVVAVTTQVPPTGTKPLGPVNAQARMGVSGAGTTESITVWWPLPQQQWLRLTSPTAVGLSVLEKDASSFMKGGSVTVPARFTFDLLPDGYVAADIDAARVTFRGPDVAPGSAGAGAGALAAEIVVEAQAGSLPVGWRPVSVGGHSGAIADEGGVTELRTRIDGDRVLSVRVPAALGLSSAELIRFAAGTHVR